MALLVWLAKVPSEVRNHDRLIGIATRTLRRGWRTRSCASVGASALASIGPPTLAEIKTTEDAKPIL
jgi:hypothetical protein